MIATRQVIGQIYRQLTLQSRHQKSWPLWMKRGPQKIESRKAQIIDYWERRLAQGDPQDITLFLKLRQDFLAKQQRDFFPVPQEHIDQLLDQQALAKTPPALSFQIKSLAGSMAAWAARGFKLAGQQEFLDRLTICYGCPQWDAKAFGSTGKCRTCGCSTQAKLRLAHEKCPEGRWGPVTENSSL